ncbi:MAG: nicotinate-nucleotide adenylyltransferase [Clostridia bacterium]|nr:nicotinate-nucleotide adenylyltransferase [Clostridia bacterium]
MQRLGIFGGTFNPPHKGHIYIALEAIKGAALDKMLFVPCGNPPHKSVEGNVSPVQRFEMTRLAIADYPDFEITDLEMKSKEPSYTLKTLEKLKILYPDAKLCFVVGGDSVRDMKDWYHSEEIFKLAEIVALRRGGIDDSIFESSIELYKETYDAEITVVDILPTDVSSSELRRKIAKGCDVADLIAPSVLEYIKEFEIYKDKI